MSRSVAVAMSGGVDSSVAAALMLDGGARPFGITMRLFSPAGSSGAETARTPSIAGRGRCCGGADAELARAAAVHLGIPFYVLDLEEEFRRLVVDRFVADYRRGRTPIPCADCNHLIKFDRLLGRALGLGARRLVTGHYARLVPDPASSRVRLHRAADPDKDQSYFLFGLTQEMLSSIDFPVGNMTKAEVRAVARRAGLPNADKPESQDICFVADGDYRDFVGRGGGGPEKSGEIVDGRGRRLGFHHGISQFTIGQRRGLGLGGGRKQYVVAVEPESRRVVVGHREEAFCRSLVTGPVNWVSRPRPARALHCRVQVRHRQRPVPARVEPRAGGNVRVVFREACAAAAPGQAAVFYDGDELLGGGWIEEVDVGRVISLGDAPAPERSALQPDRPPAD